MDSSRIQFRPAVAVDYGRVAALWRRAWSSANPAVQDVEPVEHWYARVITEFSSPNRTVLILFEGAVVGFYVVQPEHNLLDQLHIEPSHQGRGIGSCALDHIKAAHPLGMVLYASSSNTSAIRFYERGGLRRGMESVNPRTGRRRLEFIWTGKEEVPRRRCPVNSVLSVLRTVFRRNSSIDAVVGGKWRE